MPQIVACFKAKVDARGYVAVPNITPSHVVEGGPLSPLALNMFLRRGTSRPPKTFHVDDLPPRVERVSHGFISEFKVTFSRD